MVSKSQRAVSTTLVGGVLAVWFLLIVAGSVSGAFQAPRSQPPVLFGIAITVPIIVFVIAWYLSASVQRFAAALNPSTLVLLETGRVIGGVFLILYAVGRLPGLFALPAGIGDVLTGLAAPFVAWQVSSKARSWRGRLLAWSIFGMLDLVTAVSLGILNSPSPLGVLAGDKTTGILASFPLGIIPAFLVPLYFIFHVIILRALYGERASRRDQRLASGQVA